MSKKDDGETVVTYTMGSSFSGLLTLIFIVLKLLKVIDWSWLWVLAPLWISVGFAILIVIIVFVIGLFLIVRKD